MSDNSSAEPTSNLPEFTVSELSAALKRTVEESFAWVRVRGEISGFKRAASGHLYFTLKDENAVLSSVCWRGTAGRLALKPEDGMEVICAGRITTYAQRSQYQIVVEHLELAGEGALLKLLEERRKRLDAEGLFTAERKRELPFLPEVIGVVTSPTGAVIRDILHRLADRFPRHVLLWPVAVQGEPAAAQISAAIEGFNTLSPDGPVPRPELLIVARGGGSLEDLWPFNEEVVVRAAAACEIPLISAVGHETDTTLIDYAADLRAPTPTAAAELAVPVRSELLARVLDDTHRLVHAMSRLVTDGRTQLEGLGRGLGDPRRLLEAPAQRLDHAGETLGRIIATALERRRARVAELGASLPHPRHVLALGANALANLGRRLRKEALADVIERGLKDATTLEAALRADIQRRLGDAGNHLNAIGKLLDSLSYERVLERGFALVRDREDRPVTSAGQVDAGMDLSIRFHDGEVPATATDPDAARPRLKRTQGRGTAKREKEPQGTLL